MAKSQEYHTLQHRMSSNIKKKDSEINQYPHYDTVTTKILSVSTIRGQAEESQEYHSLQHQLASKIDVGKEEVEHQAKDKTGSNNASPAAYLYHTLTPSAITQAEDRNVVLQQRFSSRATAAEETTGHLILLPNSVDGWGGADYAVLEHSGAAAGGGGAEYAVLEQSAVGRVTTGGGGAEYAVLEQSGLGGAAAGEVEHAEQNAVGGAALGRDWAEYAVLEQNQVCEPDVHQGWPEYAVLEQDEVTPNRSGDELQQSVMATEKSGTENGTNDEVAHKMN